MLLLLTALTAGDIIPPRPIEPKSWIEDKDYPKDSLRQAERGYFVGNITVSADGAPLDCRPVEASTLARLTCNQLMQRARFEPARDEEGQPANGLYMHIIHYRIPGTAQPPRPTRDALHLIVDRLPEGARDPSYARIAFHVDSAGRIGKCAPIVSKTDEPKRGSHLLGAIACSQVASGYTPPVAHDAEGKSIASVQSAIVRFSTAKPTAK